MIVADTDEYPRVYFDSIGPLFLVPSPTTSMVYIRVGSQAPVPDYFNGLESNWPGRVTLTWKPLSEVAPRLRRNCNAYLQGRNK